MESSEGRFRARLALNSTRVTLAVCSCGLAGLLPLTAAGQGWPLTGAESSGWNRSTTHAEVLDFLAELEGRTDRMVVRTLGTTDEGRPHPVVFLGDPPPLSPDISPDRPTLLVLGSIHGDERSGKEGALQFLRELVLGRAQDVLDRVNVIVVPHMNPDGGEADRRQNSLGYDLNRDWIVAETPEVRGVLQELVTRYWPEVWIDAHNGGAYPYHLTYQTTLDPTADPDLVAFARGPMYDAVANRLAMRGMRMFWYSGPTYDDDASAWAWRTTEPLPRKHHSYGGIQDMIALLLEVPGSHPLGVGAAAAREGMLGVARFVADHAEQVVQVVETARRRTLDGDPRTVSVSISPVAHPDPEEFWVIRGAPGSGARRPELVSGEVRTLYVPTVSRTTPWGYALTEGVDEVTQLLDLHGIAWERLDEAVQVRVEAYRVDALERAEDAYQNHRRLEPEVSIADQDAAFPPGTLVVRTQQRGGRLVPQLFEPDAEDSLLRWNLLDAAIARTGGVGSTLPIYRLSEPPPGTAR